MEGDRGEDIVVLHGELYRRAFIFSGFQCFGQEFEGEDPAIDGDKLLSRRKGGLVCRAAHAHVADCVLLVLIETDRKPCR